LCHRLSGIALSAALGLAPLALAAKEDKTDSTTYWRSHGAQALTEALAISPNTGKAKNVILFVGDGNGIASVTASRIFDGQSRGESGEENVLSFERFPYVALSKTYNTNQQTPDSAGTMSAMVTGVKTLAGVLSLGPEVNRGDCTDAERYQLPTLLEELQQKGYSTGIVTTASVTHATPAATYAHVPERDWESDGEIPDDMKGCARDIALQLIDNGGVDVVMGGGRKHFLPETSADPEYPASIGARKDGKNLIDLWQAQHPAGRFIWNREQFTTLPTSQGPILGLFEPSHMQYEADRIDEKAEPSLAEMTASAISLLSTGAEKDEAGYFLMVESGRIDHAHHAGNAYRAMVEGQMLSQAVQAAVDNTDPDSTLIIVTADHSHVLTMAGYPTRGNPILGLVVGNDNRGNAQDKPYKAEDGKPYTTLGYMNGPGYGYYDSEQERYRGGIHQGRQLSLSENTTNKAFHQESHVPLYSETHGGEDVAIYARGPWAHLIHGVQEQSYIYYVMKHALGIE